MSLARASHSPTIQLFTATRLTYHTPSNFTTVISKFYAELGTPSTLAFPAVAKNITGYDASNKAEFIASIEKAVGPKGFMLFAEFNHGLWLPIFSLSVGLGLKRLVLGNPLIALTMLSHDLTAGIFVPVEVLVMERSAEDGGGTDVVWELPSALITGVSKNEALLEAARALDEKLEDLVRAVSS